MLTLLFSYDCSYQVFAPDLVNWKLWSTQEVKKAKPVWCTYNKLHLYLKELASRQTLWVSYRQRGFDYLETFKSRRSLPWKCFFLGGCTNNSLMCMCHAPVTEGREGGRGGRWENRFFFPNPPYPPTLSFHLMLSLSTFFSAFPSLLKSLCWLQTGKTDRECFSYQKCDYLHLHCRLEQAWLENPWTLIGQVAT